MGIRSGKDLILCYLKRTDAGAWRCPFSETAASVASVFAAVLDGARIEIQP
jgi:hypothetical protein